MVARYLDVFRRIFKEMDHDGHYKMMMRFAEPKNPAQEAVTIAPTATA
jgi:hypothetical protein